MKQNTLTKKELSEIKRQEKEEARQEASIDRLVIFRDSNGAIKYNNICSHCMKSCKQSYKSKVLECKQYEGYPRQSKHRQTDEKRD